MEAQAPRLKRNALGLVGSYAQAMGVTAPLGSVVSSLAAGAIFAGGALPLVTLLAFATSLVWVYMLTSFSKKINSAGGFYTYTSQSLGPKAGYLEAITEFLAFLFTTVFEGMYVGIIVPSLLSQFGVHLPTWSWIPLTMIGVGLAIPFTYLDVAKALTKYVAVGATLEVIVLFGLSFYIMVHAGSINTPRPFYDVSLSAKGLSGLAMGYLLAVISIDGAGTATYLSEETKRPSKTISRGMWIAAIAGGLSMVLSSYALVVTTNLSKSSVSYSTGFLNIATAISPLIALIFVALAVNSLIVSNVGTNLSASRILFSLAREGGAPTVFSKIHSKHRTPYISALSVGAISVALSIGVPLVTGFELAYTIFTIAASFCWILGRIGDSISLPFFYFKKFKEEFSFARHVLPSLVLTPINAAVLVLSCIPFTYPVNLAVGIAILVIIGWLVGFVVLRGNTEMIGSYLVDDDGVLVISKPIKV
jgi:amino acid transporter